MSVAAVCLAVGLSGCLGEADSSNRQGLSDAGVELGADSGDDGQSARKPDGGGFDGTGDQEDGGTSGEEDAGAGAGGGGEDDAGGGGSTNNGGDGDAGLPEGCADSDGACPAGCYVIHDNDCALDCRNPSTWPPEWVAFEDEVLVLTNQMRAGDQSCGGQPYPSVPPLTSNDQLREAARCHSLDMAERDYFNHFSPEGESPVDRITAAGYSWSDLGENVAGGPPRPDVVVPGWMNSPPHCTGIMADDLSEIGVGYAFDIFADPDPLNDWKHYWTQAFGHPR